MIETIVQTKTCKHCNKSFDITDRDMEFYNKILPTFAGQKFQIPTPSLCPDCRQRRRLSFRNERKLYRRKCDASGKDIISIYSPDKAYKVYDQKIRRSDARDPMSYGRNFDFTRSFTEQFGELMREVPRVAIINLNSDNSEYTNISAYNKNCYMIIESSNNEDCYYSYRLQKTNNCVDCAMCNDSSLCYKSVDLNNCYKLYNSSFCFDCSNSTFLQNCRNCSYCIGCIGIENKKYYILNKEYTKQEYEIFEKALGSDDESKKDFFYKYTQLCEENSHYSIIINSTNSDGKYIYDSDNVSKSTEIHDAKNVKYSKHVWFNSGDCVDVDTVGYNSFMIYESINTALDAYNNIFCIRCWSNCSNNIYCDNCDSISKCFGCIGLRNKSYCIFNKQYTKEEYEKTVAKIIAHMISTGERGEFFHPSLSPFGYNETVAMEYFPVEGEREEKREKENNTLSKEDLIKLGYHWSDYEAPSPQVDKIINGEDLPDSISDFTPDGNSAILGINILKVAVRCEISHKLFRIIPQELAFYIKHNIPIPRRHPDQRHLDRLALRK